jgi:hypothetical protein
LRSFDIDSVLVFPGKETIKVNLNEDVKKDTENENPNDKETQDENGSDGGLLGKSEKKSNWF